MVHKNSSSWVWEHGMPRKAHHVNIGCYVKALSTVRIISASQVTCVTVRTSKACALPLHVIGAAGIISSTFELTVAILNTKFGPVSDMLESWTRAADSIPRDLIYPFHSSFKCLLLCHSIYERLWESKRGSYLVSCNQTRVGVYTSCGCGLDSCSWQGLRHLGSQHTSDLLIAWDI